MAHGGNTEGSNTHRSGPTTRLVERAHVDILLGGECAVDVQEQPVGLGNLELFA